MESAVSKRELADALSDVKALVLSSAIAAMRAGEGADSEGIRQFIDQLSALQNRIDGLVGQD